LKTEIFRCPHKCGDPRFPRPKWKTEKGLLKHLEKCPMRPDILAKTIADKEAVALAWKQKWDNANARALEMFFEEYKIGQRVIIVSYVVTKPTHEQRFNRMVKVRYEEGRRYYAEEITIETVVAENGGIIINQIYHKCDIYNGTLEAAQREADEGQKAYDDHCKFASDCR
jgi:hypothetical protein